MYDSAARTNGKLMNNVQQQRACAATRIEADGENGNMGES
jgi:hypothetical protein